MKKLGLWIALVLIAGLALAFAIPPSRYYVLGMLHLERLHEGRPLAYWLAELKSDDAGVRRQAAFHLGGAGVGPTSPSKEECQEVVAALARAMADSDPFVRKCAAHSFLMYDKETPLSADLATIHGLSKALDDREVIVRQAAVRALWQVGPAAKSSVESLIAALADKNEDVRMYACRALARIGPDAGAAIPRLLQSLREDDDRDVRKLAAKSIGLVGVADDAPQRAEIVTALTNSLKGEPAGLREYAARTLGQIRAQEAIPALRQAAQDKNDRVRTGADEALKMLGVN